MTRNMPGQPQGGYYANQQAEYPQQSGYNENPYGQDQEENQTRGYDQYRPPSNNGQAQSYYATNDQPYQQYPQQPTWNQVPPEQSYTPNDYPAQAQHNQQQYNNPGHQSERYSPPSGPPPHYNETHLSNDLNTFKSHFDQPAATPAEYNTQSPPPTDPSDPTNANRGVLGALAGGAAGAYGGHKMGHHGFLGAIGGAVAGSMAQDAYKSHRHKLPQQQQQAPPPVPPHPSGRPDFSAAGNFRVSSRSVRLEGSVLVAECKDMGGRFRETRVDLNDCLTNTDGTLFWAPGGNFAASSRGLRLVEDGHVLEAEAGDGRGGWKWNRVWLDERITNEDGRLKFLHT